VLASCHSYKEEALLEGRHSFVPFASLRWKPCKWYKGWIGRAKATTNCQNNWVLVHLC